MSIIFHIDVNSAYLSWTTIEELKNGGEVDLRTIPAIIGGDQKSRHGVVLAKSPLAKQCGIRTGEPVANAIRKCPGLVMRPPDHKLYRQYSNMLMEFLRTYTDHIEQVSVDECYMDFTEMAPLRLRTRYAENSDSPSISAYRPTSCWQKWLRTLRSPTRCIRCSRRRSR